MRRAGKGQECERHGMRDIPMSHLTYSHTEYTCTYTHECKGAGCEAGRKRKREGYGIQFSHSAIPLTPHRQCERAQVRRYAQGTEGTQGEREAARKRNNACNVMEGIHTHSTHHVNAHTCTHNRKQCVREASAQRCEAVRRKPAAIETARRVRIHSMEKTKLYMEN